MQQRLIAARKSRPYGLAFCGAIPVGGGSDCAAVSAEPNQHRFLAILFPYQLPDIEFTRPAHFSGTGVAQMRIMGPENDFRLLPLICKTQNERVQRFSHVTVAQIPG